MIHCHYSLFGPPVQNSVVDLSTFFCHLPVQYSPVVCRMSSVIPPVKYMSNILLSTFLTFCSSHILHTVLPSCYSKFCHPPFQYSAVLTSNILLSCRPILCHPRMVLTPGAPATALANSATIYTIKEEGDKMVINPNKYFKSEPRVVLYIYINLHKSMLLHVIPFLNNMFNLMFYKVYNFLFTNAEL
jgi:hypothetical protein